MLDVYSERVGVEVNESRDLIGGSGTHRLVVKWDGDPVMMMELTQDQYNLLCNFRGTQGVAPEVTEGIDFSEEAVGDEAMTDADTPEAPVLEQVPTGDQVAQPQTLLNALDVSLPDEVQDGGTSTPALQGPEPRLPSAEELEELGPPEAIEGFDDGRTWEGAISGTTKAPKSI